MRIRATFTLAASVLLGACGANDGTESPTKGGPSGDSGSSGSSSGAASGSSGSSSAEIDSSVANDSGSSGSSGSSGGAGSTGSSAGAGSSGASNSRDAAVSSLPEAGLKDGAASDATARHDSAIEPAGDGATTESPDATASAGPCDLYAAGGAPCVAAHSTVRALFGSFAGSLYQVKRASDMTTKDIGVLTAGGFADATTQDTFCASTTCTISILYDQSSKGNHLTPGPGGGAVSTADNPASATALKTTIGGHAVYGIRIVPGMGYRNDKTSGVATGDSPETEYEVTSSKNLVNGCCFDYGNAETNNHDDGSGTMEAVYFGLGVIWGTGSGSGPWVEADLENGIFAGGPGATMGVASNTSLTGTYVTAMVIGRSGSFALKGGDATSGTLKTMYDGDRPSGYNPMKKQGAIILGIGGDNSNSAGGEFFEGVMTAGNASAAVDDAVQANIVAAGYGR